MGLVKHQCVGAAIDYIKVAQRQYEEEISILKEQVGLSESIFNHICSRCSGSGDDGDKVLKCGACHGSGWLSNPKDAIDLYNNYTKKNYLEKIEWLKNKKV